MSEKPQDQIQDQKSITHRQSGALACGEPDNQQNQCQANDTRGKSKIQRKNRGFLHVGGAKEKAGHFGLSTGVLGIEPRTPNLQPSNQPTLTQPPESEKTKYGTKSTDEMAFAPELQAVIDAWPNVPDRVRQRIIGLVEGATALERIDEA